MKNIFIGAILFLAVIAQISIFSNFFPAGTAPDIALLIIIIWTIRAGFDAVLKWAIIGGLFLDMLSFWPIGISIFSFVAVAFGTNSLGKRFLTAQFAWKFLIFSVIVAAATVLNYAIILVLMKFSADPASFSRSVISYAELMLRKEMGLKILYNLMMFSVMYWPVNKLDKIFAYYNKK